MTNLTQLKQAIQEACPKSQIGFPHSGCSGCKDCDGGYFPYDKPIGIAEVMMWIRTIYPKEYMIDGQGCFREVVKAENWFRPTTAQKTNFYWYFQHDLDWHAEKKPEVITFLHSLIDG